MNRKLRAAVAALALMILLPLSAEAAQTLVPVGSLIGIQLQDDTVTVAAFEENAPSAAKAAGLKVGDEILQIDQIPIRCTEDVRAALLASEGAIEITVRRGSKTDCFRFTPDLGDRGPKLGVYLRQGISGIGTVTWYDPESKKFGALGHGVNNARGELLNMTAGSAYKAAVVSVRKGACGAPGQLMGALQESEPLGKLYKNTSQGIFGTTDTGWTGQSLPVASASEIKTGKAVIRSTVQGDKTQDYSVEILKVYPNSGASGRNILLRITDPALLEVTGGIVQGMSGSPIIQNGKLVGAVTHVLVNDPTTGYGIFIENMLDAAA